LADLADNKEKNTPKPPEHRRLSQNPGHAPGILNGRGVSGFEYLCLIRAWKDSTYTMQSSSVAIDRLGSSMPG
jgi:hypothetical protein